MTNPTILATTEIGGHPLSIELIQPPNAAASVVIHWPTKNTSISARRFPDFAASITRLFANASVELARLPE